MQANLERLSDLERRLSVSLPASDIASEVESRLKVRSLLNLTP